MLIYLDDSGELLVSNYDDPTGCILNQIPHISSSWVSGYTDDLRYQSYMLTRTFNLTKWTNEQTKLMKQAKFMEKL